MITVLAQINTLPGAHCQLPCRYRQCQLAAQYAGFEVRREIILAFVVMFILKCPLRCQLVEKNARSRDELPGRRSR